MADQNPESKENTPSEAESAQPSPNDATDADVTTPTPEEAIEAADRAADQIKRETADADDVGDSASQATDDPAAHVGTTAEGEPLHLEDFTPANGQDGTDHAALNLLDDINLQVTVELGRTRMYIEDVLRLNENSVVELDKAAGDSVDIYVNDRLVARGEVLVLNENFCVRINEIISQQMADEAEYTAND